MAFVPFVETDQPTMAAFNEKFQSAIDSAVSIGLKLESGTYVGTGGYGTSKKNSLTFSRPVKLLFVQGAGTENADSTQLIALQGASYYTGAYSNPNNVKVMLEFSENTVVWYATGTYANEAEQLNRKGKTYTYHALCEGGDT